jgi:single-strand DNA-binding protein
VLSGARQKGKKRRIANVQEPSQLDWFVGKDAEVEAAQDNSTNFTVLSLAPKGELEKQTTNEWESHTEWHRILVSASSEISLQPSQKGVHIEVEGTLRSREQTVELKGGSKKNPETKNVRSRFVRAESIRKLDCAEKSSEDAERSLDIGIDDVPF